MTMAMLDLAAKLVATEATMPGSAIAPDGEEVANGFADLLQQLVGEGGKRPSGEDAETAGSDGEPGNGQGNMGAVPNALALPLPQLQAALASAVSGFALARAQGDVADEVPAGEAERDLLALSRLVARKASEADGTGLVMPSDDDVAMPGAATGLKAWLEGPHAAAALQTGAREARPMNLAVLSVATHFAPVAPVSDNPMSAAPIAGARATLAQAVANAAGDVVEPSDDDAMPAQAETYATVPKSAVTMSLAGRDASGGGRHDERGGGHDAVKLTVDAEAMPVAATNDAAELQVGSVTASPARQVGDELARALAGESVRPTVSHSETRAAPGKLKVLHIQLQPESLGTVTVRMEIKADVLELRIDAARAETAELIQRHREVLSSLMRSAGYSADDASIRVTCGDAAMTVSAAASAGDGGSSNSGQGSQTAGDRSAQSHGRDGGERRGEQQRPPGRDQPTDGSASRDDRDLYL